MSTVKFIFACAVSVCLALPALAQETAPEAEGTPVGGDLALGEGAGPQPGDIYEREAHGDWTVRCVRAPEGQVDPCQLYQRLSDASGNPTADVNMFDVPDGGQVAGGATVVTPLQTLLTAQVTLSVDGGAERRYPFAFCDPQGCYSRMGFTAEEMAQFRAGAVATFKVRPALAPDQEVVMEASLVGFTAGMQAVAVANPE